jgi:hypothetical protein
VPIGQTAVGVATGPGRPPRLVDDAGRAGPPRLEVYEYSHQVVQGSEDGGIITATLRPGVGNGVLLLIDRIVVQTDSSTPTTCRFYLGEVADENLVEWTGSGDIDIADETQPLYVPGTSLLIAVWSGASANAVGTVRYQYRVARLTGGGF